MRVGMILPLSRPRAIALRSTGHAPLVAGPAPAAVRPCREHNDNCPELALRAVVIAAVRTARIRYCARRLSVFEAGLPFEGTVSVPVSTISEYNSGMTKLTVTVQVPFTAMVLPLQVSAPLL